MRKIVYFILTFFTVADLIAQETKTYDLPLELSHNFTAYYFKLNNYFIGIQTSLQQTKTPVLYSNYIINNGLFNGLNNIEINLLTNKSISKFWNIGVNPQIVKNNENYLLGIRPHLIHYGSSHKLKLIAELGLNIIQQKQFVYSNLGKTPLNSTNGVVDLGLAFAYKFENNILPLRVVLGYKLFFINEFIDNDSKIYDKRFVDRSNLKISLNGLFTKNINIGLFALFQNQYYLGIATQKNAETNITYTTPFLGWELNCFLGKPDDSNNYSYIF